LQNTSVCGDLRQYKADSLATLSWEFSLKLLTEDEKAGGLELAWQQAAPFKRGTYRQISGSHPA
jgi:hypothetical protein